CFLYSHADFTAHTPLPPFPTRRSSDLRRVPHLGEVHRARCVPEPPPVFLRAALQSLRRRALCDHLPDGGALSARRRHRGFRRPPDRKSTRLNSSHVAISYAVFCLKKET